jgi:hypothetical protein
MERMFATLPAWTEPQRTLREKLGYLFALGHFLDWVPSLDYEAWQKVLKDVTSQDCTAFRDATASLQRYAGPDCRGRELLVDGRYGFMTASTHRGRFCGCPDRLPQRGPEAITRWVGGSIGVWTDSTYREFNPTLYLEAAQWWSDICGIRFHQAASKAEADIWAAVRGIDGASNTLAWSYLPGHDQKVRSAGGRSQIEQRYDLEPMFADRQGVKEVADHEIGHAAGMEHSPSKNDIMSAYYSGNKFKHGATETKWMVQRYGAVTPDVPDEPDPGDPGLPPVPPTGEPGAIHVTIEHGGKNWRRSGGFWKPIGV